MKGAVVEFALLLFLLCSRLSRCPSSKQKPCAHPQPWHPRPPEDVAVRSARRAARRGPGRPTGNGWSPVFLRASRQHGRRQDIPANSVAIAASADRARLPFEALRRAPAGPSGRSPTACIGRRIVLSTVHRRLEAERSQATQGERPDDARSKRRRTRPRSPRPASARNWRRKSLKRLDSRPGMADIERLLMEAAGSPGASAKGRQPARKRRHKCLRSLNPGPETTRRSDAPMRGGASSPAGVRAASTARKWRRKCLKTHD